MVPARQGPVRERLRVRLGGPDYEQLAASRADRYLESTALLSRAFGASGRFGGVASIWFADDLQNPDDIDRDDVLLQRWPHVEVDALPGAIPGVPLLTPSLDAQYTGFGAVDRAGGGLIGVDRSEVDEHRRR